MRDFLNFGVNSPLSLEMGHPIQSRVKRLQYVQKRGRILPTAIGLTLLTASTITSVSANTNTSVDVPATKSTVQVQASLDTDRLPLAVSETAQQKTVKLTENSFVETLPSSAAASTQNLPPLYMRFRPELTPEHIAAMEAGRQAYLSGEDKSASQLKAIGLSITHFASFELITDDEGQGHLLIKRSFDPKPLQRPVSPVMEKSLSKIINRCVESGGPDHFKFNLETADSDLKTGPLTVECWPGNQKTRAAYTHVQSAEAWLVAEDFPLERRKEMMRSKLQFAKMYDYVAANPESNVEADRAHCRQSHAETAEKYPFTVYAKPDHQQQYNSYCDTTDYDWVRKRFEKEINVRK